MRALAQRDRWPAGATALTTSNYKELVAKYEVVFVNFYTDRCPFCKILAPTFEEAAMKLQAEFSGKVLFAKVDCDSKTALVGKFYISHYPTLKAVRNGIILEGQYRGQRNIESFKSFIEELLKDHVMESLKAELPKTVEESKAAFIGYFQSRESPAYEVFRRLASDLHEQCNFYFAASEIQYLKHKKPKDRVRFKRVGDTYDPVRLLEYEGNVLDFEELREWVQESCIPPASSSCRKRRGADGRR